MSYPNQKQKRLQIIFIILIGATIPCYGLGYAFVKIKQRNEPPVTVQSTRTATYTSTPFITTTPGRIIPTKYPTFTPTLTATITPTRTPSPIPSDTPTPSWTPEPTGTDTPTATPTATELPPDTTEPTTNP
ncbi:MAG: hypothetical protein K8R16_11125 [Anaerolineales bacterium]|nr:hypothetical protein [Anaerolineales bacterium]